MSPKPFVPGTSHPYSSDCSCSECDATWLARVKSRNPHMYGLEEQRRTPGLTIALRTLLVCVVIGAVIWAGAIWWAANAFAMEGQVQPVRAPASLLRARAACPNTASIPACRAALRRAYASVEWQRKQNLNLARLLVGNIANWTCIHHYEASWTANTGNGYHGGLQMDWNFMRTYGADMLRRHHGAGAETWTPREQIIVAQRAYQTRGYHPWPQTARHCGLLA